MKKFVIHATRTKTVVETTQIEIFAESKNDALEQFYDVPEYGDIYEGAVWKETGKPDYDNYEIEKVVG